MRPALLPPLAPRHRPGTHRWAALTAATLVLLVTGPGPAPAAPPAGGGLRADYERLRPRLEESPYGIPLVVESAGRDGELSGHVHAMLTQPFQVLEAALRWPARLCDIALLHLNVKACTYRAEAQGCRLTIYSGRKYYEPPSDAYVMQYLARRPEPARSPLHWRLTAAEGPLGTHDYVIEWEAVPLADGRSFVHVHYAYAYGWRAGVALGAYLATLGRDKVGFTVVGTDAEGDPVHVDGLRGIVERNAVRYYLALQAWLETRRLPAGERFSASLERWFALTERFPEQLHELEREEYLEAKRRERAHQKELQRQIPEAADGVCAPPA